MSDLTPCISPEVSLDLPRSLDKETCCQAQPAFASSCWTLGFTEEDCCGPPHGNPACWGGEYTYERCCPMTKEVRETCWKGNLDMERRCCNPLAEDAFCWQGGNSYANCCRRHVNLVSSLSALREESVLEVVARPDLDLPVHSESVCQSGGGFVDQSVRGYLQQAEDMLRHEFDPGCWSPEFSYDRCCSRGGDPACWDHVHTYKRCCLGVNPQVAILHEPWCLSPW